MKISNLTKITVTDIKSYFQNLDWESVKDLLNWESVKERALDNPTPIICVVAILISIISVSSAYDVHKNTTETRETEVSELQKQVEEVSVFENTEKQYHDFLANIPKAISGSKMIEMLSEIAIERNVQILSFSPVSKKGNSYINLKNLAFTIVSENYADTIRFIHDIEKSPHSIRIGKWYGIFKMPARTSQRFSRRFNRQIDNAEIKNEYIEVKIEIETVEFKNE